VRHEQRIRLEDDPYTARTGVVRVLHDLREPLQAVPGKSLRARAGALHDGLDPTIRGGKASRETLDRRPRGHRALRLIPWLAVRVLQQGVDRATARAEESSAVSSGTAMTQRRPVRAWPRVLATIT
jgi:hypothetical protein